MAVYKNVASQKLAVFAYDSTDGSPKTGDAANITAQISKDGAATAATNDVNPTELDATDAPGIYIFDITQAETNADLIIVAPVSSTANIEMDPMIIYTTPGSNAAILADAVRLSGDSTAADNAEAFFDGTGYAGTNNVIPTVTTTGTATAVTTVNGLAANVINAASIEAAAMNGKGNWNIGKTDYALTATTGLGNQTANITGNLSGSVGSVTGAVGSVTGNVGGNVVGSVGSVTGSVGSVVGLTAANLDATVSSRATQTSVDDVPTNAEFNARTLVAADYATATLLATVAEYLDTEIAAILADTNELQTDWANGGRLDLLIDIIAADTTTDIPAQITALNNLSAANILTQVNAALDTAIAELSAGVPAATPTTRTALMLLYMALRNRTTTTASAQTIQNDAGTTIATATLSDDGTTMTKAEFA